MRAITVSLAVLCGSTAVGAVAQQVATSTPGSSSDSTAIPKKIPQYDTGTLPKPAPGTTLRGTVVYVYSFLDVRTEDMGPRMVDQLNSQLEQALNCASVQTKFLLFRDAETAAPSDEVRSESSRPMPELVPNLTEGRTSVPVMGTIARNTAAEAASGAKYRLVVLPSYMSQWGDFRSLDVSWRLTDINTGRVIWAFTTTDRIYQWGRNDVNSRARAASLVKKAMAALRKYGLIS